MASHSASAVRAAAVNPGMVAALGVNTTLVFSAVFAIGALLAGLAGALSAPIRSVVPGAGVSILIESFIVTVIGGMGSIGGALVAAILVGMTESLGRALLPGLLARIMPTAEANTLGASLASMSIYLLMAAVLLWRPAGLFGVRA